MAYESDDPKPLRRPGPKAEIVDAPVPPTRKGDDDPRPVRPSEDVLRHVCEEREKEKKRIAREEKARKHDARGGNARGEIPLETGDQGRTVEKWIGYSCVLLVGLGIFNVFYSGIRNVLIAQSSAERILAILLLAATGAVFTFIVAYAWSLFARLSRIESIKEDEYKGNLLKLMEKIQGDYLDRLPASEEYAARLRDSTARDDLIESLKTLRSHRYADSRAFLDDYKKFQNQQDRQAAEEIKVYALRIATTTAACPWRILDMVSVFFNSSLMICKIANIYNRRLSRAHAFKLAIRWVLNLYVSGEIGRIVDGTTDVINENLGDFLGDGLAVSIQPFLPLFSKFVGKAAEGGVNAYLAYRLGRRAIVEFRFLVQ